MDKLTKEDIAHINEKIEEELDQVTQKFWKKLRSYYMPGALLSDIRNDYGHNLYIHGGKIK